MRAPLFLNDAVRSVHWHDLRELTLFQTVRALLLSTPWLALSLALVWADLYLAAIPFSMVFFMAGLRQTHDGFHGKLGVSPRWTHAFLFLFSLLMVIPLHAVRLIHLRHHAHPLDEKDVEGMCAGMSWWKALLAGPVFSVRMILVAFMDANHTTRTWIVAELTVIAGALSVAVFLDWPLVRYQLVVMALGNCLTGFVAVWMVHRGCDSGALFARTQRSWIINLLTLNNFFIWSTIYSLEWRHAIYPSSRAVSIKCCRRRLPC